VNDNGLQAPVSQLDALRAVPVEDMLVDPAKLEAVLEEPDDSDRASLPALAGWTIASLAATVGAAIWWVATGR
jgi:hypothetical protein